MAKRPGKDGGAGIPEADKGRDLADGEVRDTERIELQRLATLREYRIMDSGPDPAFDRVTKLVADLFDVPIALVALIDDSRQWFKSTHGLAIAETPRDISFCQYVIADAQPMIVTDVLNDPRFRDNPLVTGEPFIRFYAGVPLRAHDGAVLGTLCIIDREKRSALTAQEVERLESFAAIIMAEAELRRIGAERDEARHMLEKALDFSDVAIWQFDVRTNGLRWQGAAAELWGQDVATALKISDDVFARIHPDDRERVRVDFDRAIRSGAPYATELRILHPERGVRWLAARADWEVSSDDAVLTGINIDITDQKNRQENSNLLMRELHHRMRNLFATVGAIISLTRHSARDVDDYVERVGNRLDALNRAQNVLLGANFMTGSMHALMREVEAAFARIHWTGPDLMLPENALVAMALLLNELATNAVKHGALSVDTGRVDVQWSQDPADVDPRLFRLTWTEAGGEGNVAAPERTGFGSLLMERSVRNNLGGTIERRWAAQGLVCEITLPARWSEN